MSYLVMGVTRDASGAALAGVTVKVFKASNNSFLGATISDAGGTYVVWTPGNDAVVAVGFLDAAIDLAGATLPTVVPATSWILDSATLDIDFVNNLSWNGAVEATPAALLTCARASIGAAPDITGVYAAFAANVLRRNDNGLLVEEARTNGIRNNAMQGAVAGSPGTLPTNWVGTIAGLTQTVIGTGTENGMDYVDLQYAGTATASVVRLNTDSLTVIAAAMGQTWTNSIFYRFTAAPTNVTGVRPITFGISSGGAVLETFLMTAITSLPTTFTRAAYTTTFTNAGTAYGRAGFDILVVNGMATTFTIRIARPQLEPGAFVTSPIRTSGAAVTRAADAVTRTRSSPAALSRIISAKAVLTSGVQTLWQADDATTGNRILINLASDNRLHAIVVASGVTQADLDLGPVANNTPFKVGLRAAANDFAACLNGGTMVTDTSGAMPAGLAVDRTGASSAGEYWNGLILRDTEFASRSNAQLQALTA